MAGCHPTLRTLAAVSSLVLAAVLSCKSNLELAANLEGLEGANEQTTLDSAGAGGLGTLPSLEAFRDAGFVAADDPDPAGSPPVAPCPAGSAQAIPGLCGCDAPDVDSDGDGMLDCNDACPLDASKTVPGSCECGEPEGDADEDGVPDCRDACPGDETAVAAGVCGCGEALDTDNDLVPDCADDCELDPSKATEGACGCGSPDDDQDGDAIVDCLDGCPDDPAKDDPGVCDCGEPDLDRDADGVLDCNEGCPDDANKLQPGVCGCGLSDVDSDGNGSADCTVSQLLFNDDFEQGSATEWAPTLGPGIWMVESDAAVVGNSVYRQLDVAASRTLSFAGSAQWTDVAVEARVRVDEGVDAEVYLAVRVQGPSNFYYMYMRRNGKFRVRKFVGGSTTELGPDAVDVGQLIDTGVWYTLRLEVLGSTLSMYFDGSFVGSISDPDFASGSVGIGVQDGVVSFDDVNVTQL